MRKNKIKNTKYELKKDAATGLYRIRALKNLGSFANNFVSEGTYGGLVSDKNILSIIGNCWIEYGCTVIDSTIKDDAYIGGHSYVKNSIVENKGRVLDYSKVYDSHIMNNAQVMDGANIGDHCIVKDNAIVTGNSYLRHYVTVGNNAVIKDMAKMIGHITVDKPITITTDIRKDITARMLIKFGKPTNGKYTMYKIVKSTAIPNVYQSCYMNEFVYDLNIDTEIIADNYDPRKRVLCSSGFHLFTDSNYLWEYGLQHGANVMFVCDVNVKDIIAIDEYRGEKVRVKAFTVKEIKKYPKEKELAQLKIFHGLNTKNLITYVYNNKTNTYFNKYKVIPYDRKIAIILLDIDEENDSIDNYNSVILSTLAPNAIPVFPPRSYKEVILGDNANDTFTITHNLDTKNLMVIIYDLHEYRQDIQDRCIVTHIDNKKIKITFDHQLQTFEEYMVLLCALMKPLNTSIGTQRGIANATLFSYTSVFMGANVNDDNEVTIKHTLKKIDVFGSIMNNDLNEIYPAILKRVDLDTVTIKFNEKPNPDHQFIVTLTRP